MKELRVNTNNLAANELAGLARQRGFLIKNGRKHYKVETSDGRFVTMIPRHNLVKRETAKGIIRALNKFGASINFI